METQPNVPHPDRQQGQVVMRACVCACHHRGIMGLKCQMRYQTHHVPIAQRVYSLELTKGLVRPNLNVSLRLL